MLKIYVPLILTKSAQNLFNFLGLKKFKFIPFFKEKFSYFCEEI